MPYKIALSTLLNTAPYSRPLKKTLIESDFTITEVLNGPQKGTLKFYVPEEESMGADRFPAYQKEKCQQALCAFLGVADVKTDPELINLCTQLKIEVTSNLNNERVTVREI